VRTRSRLALVARLALADAAHDRRLFGCFALTVAAVMAPLLLLLGLKTGVVEHLLDELRADPATREVIHRGHRAFDAEWFARMAARPDIAFVAPRTRELSLSIDVGRPEDPIRGQRAELIVSGAGDPLLGALGAAIGAESVVISERLARQGGFAAGQTILLWAVRAGAARARVDVPLRIAALAPARASERPAVFAPLGLVADIEDFLEGRAVPARGWPGTEPPAARLFPSFRLYAASIDDVARLDAELTAEGLNVETNAGAIAWTRRLDANLTVLFAILLACAVAGVGVALGASLWANVERKRRSLSLLRLMGLGRRALAVFPLAQGALVAGLGWLAAAAVALAVAAAMNAALAETYLGGAALCRLRAVDLAVALAVALALALAAGLAALRPILAIEPAEGLRET
jgi:putative ABC transport system permease protein